MRTSRICPPVPSAAIRTGLPLAALLAALIVSGCGSGASSTADSSGGAARASSANPASPALTSTTGATGTARSASPAATASRRLAQRRAKLKAALSTYDRCLSAHGVAIPAGASGLGALRHVDTHSAAFKRAMAACRGSLIGALRSAASSSASASASSTSPSSKHTSPQAPTTPPKPAPVPPAVTATMKSFTACMRAHGVAGFPEPTGESFVLAGTHLNPNSASYKAGEAACGHILQGLGR